MAAPPYIWGWAAKKSRVCWALRADLLGQGLEGGELPLSPEVAVKLHAQLLAVQVPGKVQDKPFHRHPSVVIGHRGPHTHVGHRHVALSVYHYPGGVDAEGGDDHRGGDTQIHRGESQGGAADLLAVGHPVCEHVGVAQKVHRPLHLPLGDQGADIGGGDGDALLLHLANDVAAHTQLLAGLLRRWGLPLPI